MKKKTWHLALGLTTIAAFWGLSFSAQASDYSAPLDLELSAHAPLVRVGLADI